MFCVQCADDGACLVFSAGRCVPLWCVHHTAWYMWICLSVACNIGGFFAYPDTGNPACLCVFLIWGSADTVDRVMRSLCALSCACTAPDFRSGGCSAFFASDNRRKEYDGQKWQSNIRRNSGYYRCTTPV